MSNGYFIITEIGKDIIENDLLQKNGYFFPIEYEGVLRYLYIFKEEADSELEDFSNLFKRATNGKFGISLVEKEIVEGAVTVEIYLVPDNWQEAEPGEQNLQQAREVEIENEFNPEDFKVAIKKGKELFLETFKREIIKITKEILLPKIKKDIAIYCADNNEGFQSKKGKSFNIFLNDCLDAEMAVTLPPEILGIKTGSLAGTPVFVPKQKGDFLNVKDEKTGLSFAQLVDENNFYIHFDILVPKARKEALAMYALTLNKLVELLGKRMARSKEGAEIKVKIASQLPDPARIKELEELSQKYAEACLLEKDKMFEEVTKELEKAEEEVAEYKKKFIEALRRQEELSGYLANKERIIEASQRMYASEFHDILKIKGVKKIEVDPEKKAIFVFTKALFCLDPTENVLRKLGRFRIEIYLGKSVEQGIRFFNLDREIEGYKGKMMHAPHVFPEGEPCLGEEMEIAFAELLAQVNIPMLVSLSIEFLQSVNVKDDAGKYISNWPEATEQEYLNWRKQNKGG